MPRWTVKFLNIQNNINLIKIIMENERKANWNKVRWLNNWIILKNTRLIANKLNAYRADVELSESISGRNPPTTPNSEHGINSMGLSIKLELNKKPVDKADIVTAPVKWVLKLAIPLNFRNKIIADLFFYYLIVQI